MAVGEAGGRAARAMAPREAGFLALLVAANLVAVTVDILLSALYPSLAACYARPVETLVLLGTPRALAQLGVLPLGALSDRVGRGRVLAGGLLLIGVAGWSAAAIPHFAAMVALQVAFGLGVAIATATVPAMAGDRYVYAVRGQVLAVTRLAMPLALIAVVPGLVALAVRHGVAWAFCALGGAAALLALLVAWRFRQPGRGAGQAGEEPAIGGRSWARPRTLGILAVGMALAIAPSSIFGFLAAWVTSTFGDPARHVGLALTGDGLGALAGIVLGALLVDRLGKRRAGVLSLVCAGACALSLPAAQGSFALVVLAVAGLSSSLEVAFIAVSALLSEAAPGARGRVMSLWAVALALGAAAAPPLARPLWQRGEMAALGTGAGFLLVGVAIALAVLAVEPSPAREGRA